jgi:N-acetylmuramic acid 6-phosphate etherase
MQATGVDAGTASAALASVDGSVKAAILVTLTGVAPRVALARLAAEDGVLRDAISSVQHPPASQPDQQQPRSQ